MRFETTEWVLWLNTATAGRSSNLVTWPLSLSKRKYHIWLHSTTYLNLWHSTSIPPYDALPSCLHSDSRRQCLSCASSRVVSVHATYAVDPGSNLGRRKFTASHNPPFSVLIPIYSLQKHRCLCPNSIQRQREGRNTSHNITVQNQLSQHIWLLNVLEIIHL